MSDTVIIQELGYSWPWHWGWVLLAGLVVSTLIVRCYLRERGNSSPRVRLGLAATRVVICGLVLLAAMNWHVVAKKFRRPELLICFDTSASLQHLDRLSADGNRWLEPDVQESFRPSRINVLRAVLRQAGDEWLQRLGADYTLTGYTIGENAQPLEWDSMDDLLRQLDPAALQSRLDENLDQMLRRPHQRPPAAVVLFTDGLDSEDRGFSRSRRTAKALDVPIFPVGLGEKKPASDLQVLALDAHRKVFLNDLAEFRLSISADGFAGRTTRLQLIDDQAQEIVAEKEITIPSDQYRDLIRFRVRMLKEGTRRFVARLFPLEEEFDQDNNSRAITVEVDAEQIRVLLAANYPSREFHFLKHFLGREAKANPGLPAEFATNRIDLDTFLQQADIEYTAVDRHAIKIFPVTRQQLFEYDVVIFCDLKPNWAGESAGGLGTSELIHLREFVEERGGGVVFVAGPRYTPQAYANSPLSPLFPIEVNSLRRPDGSGSGIENLDRVFQLRKTPLGSRFLPLELGSDEESKSFADFVGTFWFASSSLLKPAAQVLVELYDGQVAYPAIVLQKVGNGTVLYQAFPETYRWRFRTSEVYFGRYWSQMIQYLASSKLVNGDQRVLLETDRSEYYRDEPVQILGQMLDRSLISEQQLPVILENRSGTQRRIFLTAPSDPAGTYTATVDDLGPGQYKLYLKDSEQARTEFRIIDAGRENQRQPINEANLERLAAETGGSYKSIVQLESLTSQLPGREWLEIGGEPPRYFWDQPLWTGMFGAIFLILITTEWVLRKKCSML